jgi:hypothetical protein
MNEITVTLSFSNTLTIYKKKVKFFKKKSKFSKISKNFKNFIKFQNFQFFFSKFLKFSRILCNKTITTLEIDQYEVLWSRVQ